MPGSWSKEKLVSGGGAEDVCDSENFEILVRLARAEAQPVSNPCKSSGSLYSGDFRDHQPEGRPRELRERIEQLCYPAEAGSGKSDLSGRLRPYDPSGWTPDRKGDLKWSGERRPSDRLLL
jgi:hypothetical protein